MYDFIIVIAILILILSYSLKNKISLDDTSIVIFILLLIYSVYNNLSYYYILICFVFIIVLHNNSYNSTINKIKNILSPYYEKYVGINIDNSNNNCISSNDICNDDCYSHNNTELYEEINNEYKKDESNDVSLEQDYYDEMMEKYDNNEQNDEDIRTMFSIDEDNDIDGNENTNE